MSTFDYARPADLASALKLLAQPGAVPLAGGQALLLGIREGSRTPSRVVDLKQLSALRKIEISDLRVTIGALATHSQIGDDLQLREVLPRFSDAVSRIADPAVRYRATIGGSLGENHPAGDHPAMLSALNATVHTSSRDLTIEAFLVGPHRTCLEPGELVVGVSFFVPRFFAYAKAPHPASKYALAGVAIAVFENDLRVAVTGAGANGVFRWGAAEEALKAELDVSALEALPLPASEPLQDNHHASAAYRAQLVAALTAQALRAAMS